MDLADSPARANLAVKDTEQCAGLGPVQLDRYARIARSIAGVPVATVTLVSPGGFFIGGHAGDMERGGFIAGHLAFCTHALKANGTFYVPDLTVDARFADHPLVVGEPGFGFYAAAPLFVPEREAVGSLCLLDYRPRELTTAQLRAIRLLGDDLQREFQSP